MKIELNEEEEEEKKSDEPVKPKRVVTLDDFKIIKKVGRGSFGSVFLVEDK